MNTPKILVLGTTIAATLVLGCTHSPAPQPAPSNPVPGNPANPGGPANPADPERPSFKNDILPIFLTYCSGCHNATTSNEGYVFISYETITAKKFVSGNPDDTKLYDAITDDDEEDRMPKTPNPRLSSDRIQLIKKWILNGAPNN